MDQYIVCIAGVKMAWNHHVHFELHGICSVLQGKGDFAIQEVKIAQTREVQSKTLPCFAAMFTKTALFTCMHNNIFHQLHTIFFLPPRVSLGNGFFGSRRSLFPGGQLSLAGYAH